MLPVFESHTEIKPIRNTAKRNNPSQRRADLKNAGTLLCSGMSLITYWINSAGGQRVGTSARTAVFPS